MTNLTTKCSYYPNVYQHIEKDSNVLTYKGRDLSILDLLTDEKYTNTKLLNDLRLSGYGSKFYKENKYKLSAACFSSMQHKLEVDRTDENHLAHTGYIAFDIDVDDNPYLLTDGESIKECIIDKMPYCAYIGKSVSNIGYWGLFPILNKEEHYPHYEAMKLYFKAQDIHIDGKVHDISRLRFLAYDPDGYINNDAKLFTDTVTPQEQTIVTDEYERANVTDELFIAACRWVEAKHEVQFKPGSIHNYLLYLYSTLRGAKVPRYKILNWVYNNLIDEEKVTTNCLQETKWKR